jgi:hypothetical protein
VLLARPIIQQTRRVPFLEPRSLHLALAPLGEARQRRHSVVGVSLAKMLTLRQAPLVLVCSVSQHPPVHLVRRRREHFSINRRRRLVPLRVSHLLVDARLTHVMNKYVDLATTATGPYDGVAPVSTGSANPPYSTWSEKDAANSNVTLQYQSISCMPQYRGSSFEVRV